MLAPITLLFYTFIYNEIAQREYVSHKISHFDKLSDQWLVSLSNHRECAVRLVSHYRTNSDDYS